MPILNSGETYNARGNMDVSSGTLTLRNDQIGRTKLTQENLVAYGIPLTQARVWDSPDATLGAAASDDDLGLVDGAVWGTNSPTLQTTDLGEGTDTCYARFMVPLPAEYVAGETVKIRVVGGMVTAVADTSATVDLECYVNGADGTPGSELCATAATTINAALLATTPTTVDFTITSTTLAPGDILDCRLAIAITDSGTAVVIGAISQVTLLCDIRG